MRLFAIRHGATESWRERRFAGSRDVPLAADGRLQAEAVAQALREAHVAAVYSSPLERARASAEIIAAPFGLDVCVEPAFRDISLGAWEGLTRDEVAARFPAEMAAWRATPHLATVPGGETVPTVSARVLAGLAELRAVHEGEAVVLVSHAMVLQLLVLAALGLGPERLWAVEASVAGITEIEYHGEWATVHRMNTLAHLDGLREGVA